MPPRIQGILETPVYVDDLDRSHAFYHGILGLERMLKADRIHAYNLAPGQVLIVCLRGACEEDSDVGGNKVPGHRADGPGHFAFRIDSDTMPDWLTYLAQKGIAIESAVTWPSGRAEPLFSGSVQQCR